MEPEISRRLLNSGLSAPRVFAGPVKSTAARFANPDFEPRPVFQILSRTETLERIENVHAIRGRYVGKVGGQFGGIGDDDLLAFVSRWRRKRGYLD